MTVPRTKQSTIIVKLHNDDTDLLTRLLQDSQIPCEIEIYKKHIKINIEKS